MKKRHVANKKKMRTFSFVKSLSCPTFFSDRSWLSASLIDVILGSNRSTDNELSSIFCNLRWCGVVSAGGMRSTDNWGKRKTTCWLDCHWQQLKCYHARHSTDTLQRGIGGLACNSPHTPAQIGCTIHPPNLNHSICTFSQKVSMRLSYRMFLAS